MKKADVQIGERYYAKVSGKVQVIRITGLSILGGWAVVNESTGRQIRIKSAQKLRGTVGA